MPAVPPRSTPLHRLRKDPRGPGDEVTDPDAHRHATWTSFDRFDRYVAIAGVVRSALGPGRHRVLDVGDTAGYLRHFEPELWVTNLDVYLVDKRLETDALVVGDGSRLPFADGSFDAVVSSDVLEHVPEPRRVAFLRELHRVSRDVVVVAAPFDTPGVRGTEDFVRRYAMLALGAAQPQLEEHHQLGLPQLDATVAALTEAGGTVAALGNGNLHDWMASMLLRFQLEARPALQPLSEGYDSFANQLPRQDRGPYYRHVVVSWRDRAPQLVPDDLGDAAPSPSLADLAAILLAADSTEVVRQDLVGELGPPVHAAHQGVLALHQRLDPLSDIQFTLPGRLTHLDDRLDLLGRQLEQLDARLVAQAELGNDTRARLETLFESQMEVNGPVLRAKAKARAVRNKLRRR